MTPAIASADEGLDSDDASAILGQVEIEIAAAREDLDESASVNASAAMSEVGRVDRRLREGEIHFLLKDYLRAAIVLVDVVDDPSTRSHPRYDDCVFLLADALSHAQNHAGARHYFEELLPRASGERLKDVVVGLLEIASATNDYRNVDRYIGHLRDAGTMSRPDVDYIHGKTIFKGSATNPENAERALEIFRKIPMGTSVAPQASYYAGVSLVRLGRNADAAVSFENVVKMLGTMSDADSVRLRELAHLSRGRLYQELGDTQKATEAYQSIPQASPYFPEMLFEMAWTHVHDANRIEDPKAKRTGYERALEAAELLMATSPDSRLFPEARLLEGNLQIRLGASDNAYETFQTIVDRYGSAGAQLDATIRGGADPRQFFAELLATDLGHVGNTSTILPPIALAWALEEDGMTRAVDLQRNLETSRGFLDDSRELVETLDAAVEGEGRFNLVPGLASLRSKTLAVENRIVNLGRRLLSTERRMLWPTMTPEARAAFEAARERSRAVTASVETLPQTTKDVDAAREVIRRDYRETGLRAYRLGYQVSALRAQLVAADVWLEQNREHLKPDELVLMQERMRRTGEEVGGLERELEDLERVIRKTAALAGVDAGRSHTRRIRGAFDSAASEELALLAQHRRGAQAAHAALLVRIDGQRAALSKLQSDLDRLHASFEARVEQRVAEVRTSIAAEAERLGGFSRDHTELAGATSRALSPVASATLNAVGGHFRELVRSADIGIIDVAWARKQSETQKVNVLIKEQNERTQELEAEFEDVLKE